MENYNHYFIDSDKVVNKVFFETLKSDLICIICHGLLNEPLMCSNCENTFCKYCINFWLTKNKTCPFKCSNTNFSIKECSKIIKNLMENIILKCKNACQINLLEYSSHIKNCIINNPDELWKIKKDNFDLKIELIKIKIDKEKEIMKVLLDNKKKKENEFNHIKKEYDGFIKNFKKTSALKNKSIHDLEKEMEEIIQEKKLNLFKKFRTTFHEKIKNEHIKFSNNNKTITKIYEDSEKYRGTSDADYHSILCKDKIGLNGNYEIDFKLDNLAEPDFYLGVCEDSYCYRDFSSNKSNFHFGLSMCNSWINGDYDSFWSLNDDYYEFNNGDVVSLCINMDEETIFLKNNRIIISKIIKIDKLNSINKNNLCPYITFAGEGFQITLV